MDFTEIFHSEIEGYRDDKADLSFEEAGIDSFDLISLRTAFENRLGHPIPDHIWITLQTPRDILRAASGMRPAPEARAFGSVTPLARREHTIDMPQMALGGLSESWLFKEIGDFHWKLITDGLATPSARLRDGNGERLYATFTRIRIQSSAALSDFEENERFVIDGDLARFGAGIFLGHFSGSAGEKHVTADLMSSFTRRSNAHSNRDLMKGQPQIPENCPIRILSEKPAFGEEYRARRNGAFPDAIFECDYAINPYQDINGVGLIYFAAYPMISDICELRHMGEGNNWALRASTLSRDVYYFANADAHDTLTYRLLSHDETDGTAELHSLISRKENGQPMAYLITRKALKHD